MERTRVVAVRGPHGLGSGYVVAPRLVLTSAHVVPALGAPVRLFRPGRAPVFDAVVVWRGKPGGRNDAALLRVDDPTWEPVAGPPVRWGRTVTYTTGVKCESWGVPNVVQRPDRAVDAFHPSGTLNPGDRFVGNRYVMIFQEPAPVPVGPSASPLGGMSGAALFCDGLLAGVVASDPAGFSHSRLEAVPAYVLHRDPDFRAVLAEHCGPGADVLEPVEWQHLADPGEVTPPGGPLTSPAALLRARRQVVPFRGRGELLDRLTAWCERPGFGAWLVHGSGGQGKTRLAQQLAVGLDSRRWSALWLRTDAGAEPLGALKDSAGDLLVIVDYAETREPQLTALLDAAARHSGESRFKVLMLARTAGDWWRKTRRSTPATEELLDGAGVTELPQLEPDPAGQVRAYELAVNAFAAALPRLRGQQGLPWGELAKELTRPAAARTGLENALTLHMTALVDLLDAAESASTGSPQPDRPADDRPVDDRPVEDRLLGHEERYWRRAAEVQELSSKARSRDDVMVAAFLCGAEDDPQADSLLKRVPALAGQPADELLAVRGWIASLYPSASGRPWDSLQPDRLAERFIGRRLVDDPELAHALVEGATEAQAAQLLTVYSRAAAHRVFDHRLGESLTELCVRHRAVLARTAVDTVTRVESPLPLLAALRRISDDPSVPLAELERLSACLPETSENLADWPLLLCRRLVDEYRGAAQDDPDATVGLAGNLNNLALRLAESGQEEQALAAANEAAALLRGLDAQRLVQHLPALAMTLGTLSTRLSALGQAEEALSAIEEALWMRRLLAARLPAHFRSALAGALTTLGDCLAGVGRHQEALAATTEAVEIERDLLAQGAQSSPDSRDAPGSQGSDLATSLSRHASALAAVGRSGEALAAAREVVDLTRALAADRPDAHLPHLAGVLANLAIQLRAVGEHRETLAAVTESVALWRRVAAARPDAHLPDLAGSLNTLSLELAEAGEPAEALATAREAVDISRRLASIQPAVHTRLLAGSLINLSIHLAGRPDEELAAAAEAVRLWRQLAATRPEECLPDLAMSLDRLFRALKGAGRIDEALAPGREKVAIYRELAAARPYLFQHDLALSLIDFCTCSQMLGEAVQVLPELREAVGLFRVLAAADPESYLKRLAPSLYQLTTVLQEAGHRDEATRAFHESVDIRRTLAATDPDENLPLLAKSLDVLAEWSSDSGRAADGLAAAREALELWRRLAAADPSAANLANLALSLDNLSELSSRNEQPEQAVRSALEAVDIHCELAGAGLPRPVLHRLAARLVDWINELRPVEGAEELELELNGAAVRILRDLSAMRFTEYAHHLSTHLVLLSLHLSEAEEESRAQAAAREAVTVLRRLAAVGLPDDHLLTIAEALLA
ncbi:hypothetical protein GCM10009759_72210 [Kitasatospora saccharophila]|uniref:Tetratricopeptide repeat protein n=1 Tax=Kitasatospora saccharophila TaxID=407973 RepID=A0ABN2Y631_9ACTN